VSQTASKKGVGMSTTATTSPLLVLWDQDCSFCSRAVAYASVPPRTNDSGANNSGTND
jgi:hypothetical protein